MDWTKLSLDDVSQMAPEGKAVLELRQVNVNRDGGYVTLRFAVKDYEDPKPTSHTDEARYAPVNYTVFLNRRDGEKTEFDEEQFARLMRLLTNGDPSLRRTTLEELGNLQVKSTYTAMLQHKQAKDGRVFVNIKELRPLNLVISSPPM